MDRCTNCARKTFCCDFSGDLGICKSYASDSQIQPNEALREARDRTLADAARKSANLVPSDPKFSARANGELPATPCVHRNESFSGLTKREAFAMAAMQGLLTDHCRIGIGELAAKCADALLLALERKEGAA